MTTEHPHSHRQELLPLYALRALDDDAREEVEGHLRSCRACRRELAELEADLALLAEAPGPETPPSHVRRDLLREIETRTAEATAGIQSVRPAQVPVSRRRNRSTFGGRWMAVAAALLLVAGGLWVVHEIFQSRDETDVLRAEHDRLERELSAAQARIDALEEQRTALVRELHTLRDPSGHHVLLAGLEAAPEASARTVVSSTGDFARLYAFGLPELPEAQDYELWLIVDGRPVPAGVFDVDESGRAEIDVASLPPLDSIEAWAVTVEPAGGVPEPTGSMVLKG